MVTRVPIYRWALPEDIGPLRAALSAIAERRIGAALFTAAQQVEHVLQVAAAAGIETRLARRPCGARRRRLDRADDLGRPSRARLCRSTSSRSIPSRAISSPRSRRSGEVPAKSNPRIREASGHRESALKSRPLSPLIRA